MGEPMKNKGGRPKAADPLCVDMKIRLTRTDVEKLDAYCNRHRTNRAAVIRGAMRKLIEADAETK